MCVCGNAFKLSLLRSPYGHLSPLWTIKVPTRTITTTAAATGNSYNDEGKETLHLAKRMFTWTFGQNRERKKEREQSINQPTKQIHLPPASSLSSLTSVFCCLFPLCLSKCCGRVVGGGGGGGYSSSKSSFFPLPLLLCPSFSSSFGSNDRLRPIHPSPNIIRMWTIGTIKWFRSPSSSTPIVTFDFVFVYTFGTSSLIFPILENFCRLILKNC